MRVRIGGAKLAKRRIPSSSLRQTEVRQAPEARPRKGSDIKKKGVSPAYGGIASLSGEGRGQENGWRRAGLQEKCDLTSFTDPRRLNGN